MDRVQPCFDWLRQEPLCESSGELKVSQGDTRKLHTSQAWTDKLKLNQTSGLLALTSKKPEKATVMNTLAASRDPWRRSINKFQVTMVPLGHVRPLDDKEMVQVTWVMWTCLGYAGDILIGRKRPVATACAHLLPHDPGQDNTNTLPLTGSAGRLTISAIGRGCHHHGGYAIALIPLFQEGRNTCIWSFLKSQNTTYAQARLSHARRREPETRGAYLGTQRQQSADLEGRKPLQSTGERKYPLFFAYPPVFP